MKVIFLDIDGVLNTEHGLKTLSNNWTNMEAIRGGSQSPFCPQAVAVLSEIINMTGAKLVISSTWRASGLDWIRELWEERDLPGEIIDITGHDETRVRGKEVDSWIRSRGWYYPIDQWNAPAWQDGRDKCEIEGYVIIDDDRDFFIDQAPHFVHTPAYYGLAGEGKLEEVIKALNVKPE